MPILVELPDSQSGGEPVWINAAHIHMIMPLQSDDRVSRCSVITSPNLDAGIVIDCSATECVRKINEAIQKNKRCSESRDYLSSEDGLYNDDVR